MTINYLQEMGIEVWRMRPSLKPQHSQPAPQHEPVMDSQPHSLAPEELAPQSTMPQSAVPEQLDKAEPQLDKELQPHRPHQEPQPYEEPDSWQRIVADLQSGSLCSVCQSSNPILGEGNQQADLVVVIDSPSTQDVAQQRLLSGRSGQLFDAILRSLGEARESIYLTSVFKCPPADDYTLESTCSSLLLRQIALIQPKRVMTFGEFTAQALLKSNDDLSQLRQQIHVSALAAGAQVVTTHGLSEILTQPALKAEVWQDLSRLLNAV